MMKKITYYILLSFICNGIVVNAQQFPIQSQYQFNYSSINPAAVGETENLIAKLSLRQQWIGFSEKGIGTNIFSLNKGYGNNGLGLNIFDDQTGGAFSKTGASLAYSHRVPFENSELFLGISGGFAKVDISTSEFDPAIISNDDIVPEATFGALYKFENYTFGISIPGLLNANMELTESNSNVIYSHFYTMFSYEKKINENWSIYPSVLLKTAKESSQYDLNVNLRIRNKVWVGASYREDFGPSLYVGLDLGKLLSVYSYDISTNEVSSYSNGSHEVTLVYEFVPDEKIDNIIEKKKEVIKVLDKDKDGIVDSLDICPDLFGDKQANGCPDTDKDGIPDKFDVCPNLFGDKKAQGCPILSYNEKNILENALVNLQFGFDKDEIEYSSYNTLTDLSILMLKNPNMNLVIEGHASEEGSEKYNLSLSARRAKSVQNFFIKRGIDKNRLTIDFYGEGSPISNNKTEESRALNRRVEFDIIFHQIDQKTVSTMIAEYNSLLNKIGKENLTTENKTKEKENTESLTNSQESKKEVNKEENDNELSNKDKNQELSKDNLGSSIANETKNQNSNNENFDSNKTYFILVTEVFSSEKNAKKVIRKSDSLLEYIPYNNKFYVFAKKSNNRLEVENFRKTYKDKSWIKTIK